MAGDFVVSGVVQFRDPNNIESFLDFVKSLVDMDNYNFIDCPTAVKSKGPFHKQDVVAAVLKTGGVYSEMALLLNRRRQSVKNYIHSNRDVLLFFTDIRESLLAEVERPAFEQALNGNPSMQRFMLSTLGKDRGYTKRLEQTGAGGGPIDIVASPKEQLKEKVKLIADRSNES